MRSNGKNSFATQSLRKRTNTRPPSYVRLVPATSRHPPLFDQSPARTRGRAKFFDQFSFEQSRGVIFLSVAYLAETSFTMGSVIVSSAVYQSEITFHVCPFHCWMRAVLAPSWSAQETLIGLIMPSKPSSLRRASSRSRFSSPQRTCSPVRGLLPTFS